MVSFDNFLLYFFGFLSTLFHSWCYNYSLKNKNFNEKIVLQRDGRLGAYHHSGEALDADNMEHVEWVFKAALKRATKYNIRGVDLRLTKGVLKKIVPAVASTNAVIAGNIIFILSSFSWIFAPSNADMDQYHSPLMCV